jgi:hypothetical protein
LIPFNTIPSCPLPKLAQFYSHFQNFNDESASQKKITGKTVQNNHIVFSDEATKDKIKRHLTDIRDVITDRDIANVKIPGKENHVINPPGKETHVMPDTIASTNNKPVTPYDAQEE